MGFETTIMQLQECGCHTLKISHDFFDDTNYETVFCTTHKKIITHRRCVKAWKENNKDKHKEHKKKEYINKKIKFIFLNILL